MDSFAALLYNIFTRFRALPNNDTTVPKLGRLSLTYPKTRTIHSFCSIDKLTTTVKSVLSGHIKQDVFLLLDRWLLIAA